MLDTYIEDTFGKRYVLKRQSDLTSQKSFTAMSFSDESQAYQFINKLRTPHDYCSKTISRLGTLSARKPSTSNLHAERIISQLLYRKQIFIYEVSASSLSNASAIKRSIQNPMETIIYSLPFPHYF